MSEVLGLSLPPPLRPFPLLRPLYEVIPGLKPLDRDEAGGPASGTAFWFDADFEEFRANRMAARAAALEAYYPRREGAAAVLDVAARRIAVRLAREHPRLFRLDRDTLHCAPTGETLELKDDASTSPYVDRFDAVVSQIQEDVAVVQRSHDEGDRIVGLHVCSPSAWAPREKLGMDFRATHAPVPHFERIAARGDGLVNLLSTQGPFVRYGWGLSASTALNLHPERVRHGLGPPDEAPDEPFVMRVERQVFLPMPDQQAFLFLIRVTRIPGSEICRDPERSALLRGALDSMSEETLRYKGLLILAERARSCLHQGPRTQSTDRPGEGG